jgi:hypothetical protein
MEAQMRTARTTVLLTDAERANLDAFATSRGESVSNVVRDATVQYMAQPRDESDDEEQMLKLLIDEINDATPRILASMDRLSAKMQAMHEDNDAFLRKMGVRQ